MRHCALISLLLAAGANTALAKSQSLNWQSGEVVRVGKPEQRRKPGWGTVGPHVSHAPQVIALESSSFGVNWGLAIAMPGTDYIISLSPPPRKSSLHGLEPGDRLECAVKGKDMYLRDEKGTVFRARIRERLPRLPAR